jgi:D-sedoheptulose 7-phosphate isomerase
MDKIPSLARGSFKLHDLIARSVFTDHKANVLDKEAGFKCVLDKIKDAKRLGKSVFIIGNGGSASVAGHAAVDFVNIVRVDARTIHEPPVLTCMANDYGYDDAYSRILAGCIKKDDLLIAISSSGKSKNILSAVRTAHKAKAHVLTLSGFGSGNALRKTGDVNIWLDSNEYGQVEIGHLFILHTLADSFRH